MLLYSGRLGSNSLTTLGSKLSSTGTECIGGALHRGERLASVFHLSPSSCYLNLSLVSPKIQHYVYVQAVLPLQGRVKGHYYFTLQYILNAALHALTTSLLSGKEFVIYIHPFRRLPIRRLSFG